MQEIIKNKLQRTGFGVGQCVAPAALVAPRTCWRLGFLKSHSENNHLKINHITILMISFVF